MMNESEKTQEFYEKYDRLIAKIKEKGSELYRLETSDRNQPFYIRARESTDDLELFTGPEKNKHGGYLQKSRLREYVLHGIDRGIDKNKHKDHLSYYRGVLKALDLSFPIPEHIGAPEHGDREKSVVVTVDGQKCIIVVEESHGDTEYKLKDEPLGFNAHKTDHIQKAKDNKKTGDDGEKWVFAYEQQRVLGKYRDKVKHSSADKGDGLGYDILSVTETGEKKYIEVKATTGEFEAPFFVTATELRRCNRCNKRLDEYYLYRVHNLNKGSLRLRVIPGEELIRLCDRPANYNISLDKPPA